ncbi:MAG: hypothetical protein DMF85_14920 [Acidobacteria bacterium]|nr:MAG: hypothetical protein DMF85_14920 [Acidobacteriota bacterium]
MGGARPGRAGARAGGRRRARAAARGRTAAGDRRRARACGGRGRADRVAPEEPGRRRPEGAGRRPRHVQVDRPGTPLVVITDLDHAWANVYVDEPSVPRLRLGAPAVLVTDAGQRLNGSITFISPKAEFTPRNVQTAEERSKLVYRVKVSVDNRDGVLKPGMPVEAELGLK